MRGKDWTGHEVQNEQTEITAHAVLRHIITEVQQREYYASMGDEATHANIDTVTGEIASRISTADHSNLQGR